MAGEEKKDGKLKSGKGDDGIRLDGGGRRS